MFRTFLVSSKKLLQPRPLQSPVLESAALYDVRRSRHTSSPDLHGLFQPIRPTASLYPSLGISHTPALNSVRWAANCSQQPWFATALVPLRQGSSVLTGRSGFEHAHFVRSATTSADKTQQFQMPDPAQIVCNMLTMLKCVDLQHLKDSPEPALWTSLAIGGSQLVIPFLELVGGYSPVLTMLQLHMAAVGLGFSGGMRWGLGISNNPQPPPTWDTMRWALLPPGLAVTGLILPYPLGFLTVASGMVASLYLDLKSCAYPPWALASSLFITLTSVAGLLLAFAAYVLFSNGKQKKSGKVKEAPPPKEEDSDGSNDDETDGK